MTERTGPGGTAGTSKDDKGGAEPTGGEQSSAERSGPDHEEHAANGGTAPEQGEGELAGLGDQAVEGGTRPAPAGRTREGMFGVRGSGDTSGFSGLRLPAYVPAPAERPFGGWFDDVVDDLVAALDERGTRGAIQQVTIDRDELTLYIAADEILNVCRTMRDDASLRFELCSAVSAVDYGVDVPQRMHVVYHLLSMTYRKRIRLEVALDWDGGEANPHVPSVVEVYPTADWHERETWDMFGIVFDGHPALTRILMPDDWDGHPQRKDYPLGGIPVEYKGAEIPPPDERRAYS